MQPYTVECELRRFAALAALRGRGFAVEPLCEHGVLLKPDAGVKAPGKPIALTLMGLTHGNELAGLGVLNGLLALLHGGALRLEIPLAVVLGNPPAARETKRFLDRDLNRCFARAGGTTREERRAKELEGVLKETAYLVDFHQVSRASDRPFFIFPYNPKSFAFARAIAPRQTIVTHWGKPFSAEGMCSDEFTNVHGGVGISLELGQNGFDPYQISSGLESALWAIRTVTDRLAGHEVPLARVNHDEVGELYTWADITPWPEVGVVELDEGWTNFRDVALGQRLGTVGGRELLARAAGKMLFPKYLSREAQAAQESRPTELCRIMKLIGTDALPSGA